MAIAASASSEVSLSLFSHARLTSIFASRSVPDSDPLVVTLVSVLARPLSSIVNVTLVRGGGVGVSKVVIRVSGSCDLIGEDLL